MVSSDVTRGGDLRYGEGKIEATEADSCHCGHTIRSGSVAHMGTIRPVARAQRMSVFLMLFLGAACSHRDIAFIKGEQLCSALRFPERWRFPGEPGPHPNSGDLLLFRSPTAPNGTVLLTLWGEYTEATNKYRLWLRQPATLAPATNADWAAAEAMPLPDSMVWGKVVEEREKRGLPMERPVFSPDDSDPHLLFTYHGRNIVRKGENAGLVLPSSDLRYVLMMSWSGGIQGGKMTSHGTAYLELVNLANAERRLFIRNRYDGITADMAFTQYGWLDEKRFFMTLGAEAQQELWVCDTDRR